MKKKALFSIGFILIFATVAITLFSKNPLTISSDDTTATQQAPTMRPEFSFPDLQGQLRNIKEWDGNYIVLNFWATWCPPCREEIPEFIAMQKKYGATNLQFIGVAIDNTVSVNKFALEVGINYPNLIAEIQGLDLARQYGNTMGALPFFVIINPEGRIITRQVGLLERSKILKSIQLSKG